MPTSEARIRANRLNAQKSTGPKTPEGKARSRCNGFKHGLTGEGVALPTEDQEAISECFAAMQDEMRPSNRISQKLLRRAAFLFVRVERCEKHETAETARRIRHAVADFDDQRLAAVEALAARIEIEPATTSRRLQGTIEGINWLLTQWEILHDDLTVQDRDCWTYNHRSRFELLLGRNPADWRIGRVMALTEAAGGGFYHLDKKDGEGLEGQARADWARDELRVLMEAEMARLEAARLALRPDVVEKDRAEAVDRALFDTSKASMLARKYEAAAERDLFRTLKEFREVEEEAAEGREKRVFVEDDERCEPLGSDFPEPEEEAQEDEAEPSPALPMVPPADFSPARPASEGPDPVKWATKGPA